MAVLYGYLKNTDDATMGALKQVPHLKEVGVTSTNDHFVVFGTKKEVRAWFREHSSLKVTASDDASVRVTSRVRKVHKRTLEGIGGKIADQIPSLASSRPLLSAVFGAPKLMETGVGALFSDSQPWMVHFELYPNRKEPESIDVLSNTPLENFTGRLSLG